MSSNDLADTHEKQNESIQEKIQSIENYLRKQIKVLNFHLPWKLRTLRALNYETIWQQKQLIFLLGHTVEHSKLNVIDQSQCA